jgi:hypothetical protein
LVQSPFTHMRTRPRIASMKATAFDSHGHAGVIVWVPGFFWRTSSRVLHIKFTRELFLRYAVLHIFLQNCKRGRNYHFYFRTVHPRGGSHLPLRCCFGFLHTQQLRCFDESRNDQRIIRNRSSKINTIAASLYLPASYFSFRVLRLAQKKRANGKWQKSCFLTVRMEVKII